MVAKNPVLGEKGSCACTTSGPNCAIARRMRARLRGSGQTGATEPLNGILKGRPTMTTSGSEGWAHPGARISVWWPRARRQAASCRTWVCTPPGASQAYGQARATFTAASPSRLRRPGPVLPCRLEHMPVLWGGGDGPLEAGSDEVREDSDVLAHHAAPFDLQGRVDHRVPPLRGREHGAHAQRRPSAEGQQGRAGRKQSPGPEHLDLDASPGQVAVGDQSDDPVLGEQPNQGLGGPGTRGQWHDP